MPLLFWCAHPFWRPFSSYLSHTDPSRYVPRETRPPTPCPWAYYTSVSVHCVLRYNEQKTYFSEFWSWGILNQGHCPDWHLVQAQSPTPRWLLEDCTLHMWRAASPRHTEALYSVTAIHSPSRPLPPGSTSQHCCNSDNFPTHESWRGHSNHGS